MKSWNVTILVAVLNLPVAMLAASLAHAQFPPAPHPIPQLEHESADFSAQEFQRLLTKLKNEREGLDADWRSLTKRLSKRPSSNEPDLEKLQEQLKQTIVRLQQERIKFQNPPVQPFLPKNEVPVPEGKKKTDDVPPVGKGGMPSASPAAGSVDVVHLAQTLYRAERYEEALAAFRSVDLKSMKPEERAPIVYLTAACLHQMGKTDDAIALLRDVANSRGDEQMAGYAQWEIENLRWHRETRLRLNDIRQRLLGIEKR
jgi:tetratricopeptide (TPR) repeat protein